VVRGAEEEDAFAINYQRRDIAWLWRKGNVRIRPVDALVGPCSSRPGVRVASVPVSMSLRSLPLSCTMISHGAIIARAFGVGIETSPCCDEAVPMGVVELGTASSQPSSCLESCCLLSVYQEPACEALRVTILANGRIR
jgi:hypothetical protein